MPDIENDDYKTDEAEWIELPSKEDVEQAQREFKENLKWAQSLTKQQINFLCDGGWYNNTIRGYLIIAARNADFTKEQIRDLLGGLRWAFSEHDKEDADNVSNKF